MKPAISSIHCDMTLMGTVTGCDYSDGTFSFRLMTADEITIRISRSTSYEVIKNIDGSSQDNVDEPTDAEIVAALGTPSGNDSMSSQKRELYKYVKPGRMLCIVGVYSREPEHVAEYKEYFGARRIVLMHSTVGAYRWEDSHWWLRQTNVLFEQWLDTMFGSKREFTESDFAISYRTNLDLLGSQTEDETQECATLSRFLYGLSSSYLLTGNPRSLSAAKACATYLINAYEELSHDRERLLWKFGRRRDGKSTKEIHVSEHPDDKGSYALYEQIYVLSGLAQYYRITLDPVVLDHITRTINAFQTWFFDEQRGGYYSHLDPVTMQPVGRHLESTDNVEKKNWNSIGDHIPAYLVNLILAIDPLPHTKHFDKWKELLKKCREVLDECVNLILDKFPPTDGSDFVFERFFADFEPQLDWGWQQNRAIVGHNLKIAWNLTRCGHYYEFCANRCDKQSEEHRSYKELSRRCFTFAIEIGKRMIECGVDLVRGGIFDALEREPTNGMRTDFAWSTTKDFWQQEQAILAYYIMYGIRDDDVFGGPEEAAKTRRKFLEVARQCTAFWNLFFIDFDNRKVYFRTNESGQPVISGQYGIQGGHAIAGYHAFELNFLVHLYIKSYVEPTSMIQVSRARAVKRESFVLCFCPQKSSSVATLNVLPDFFSPDSVEIVSVHINGLEVKPPPTGSFAVDISTVPPNSLINVEMRATGNLAEGIDDLEMLMLPRFGPSG